MPREGTFTRRRVERRSHEPPPPGGRPLILAERLRREVFSYARRLDDFALEVNDEERVAASQRAQSAGRSTRSPTTAKPKLPQLKRSRDGTSAPPPTSRNLRRKSRPCTTGTPSVSATS